MNKQIEINSCKSSNIEGYGYCSQTNTLAVKFKSGGVYHYSGFSPDKYKEFEKAESKGKHLPKAVKGLKFEKIK